MEKFSTLVIVCDPYLNSAARHDFYDLFEEAYGFTPALAFRVSTNRTPRWANTED